MNCGSPRRVGGQKCFKVFSQMGAERNRCRVFYSRFRFLGQCHGQLPIVMISCYVLQRRTLGPGDVTVSMIQHEVNARIFSCSERAHNATTNRRCYNRFDVMIAARSAENQFQRRCFLSKSTGGDALNNRLLSTHTTTQNQNPFP